MMREGLVDIRRNLGVVEALTEARDLLVSEGWVQGAYIDQVDDESNACRRCSLGALRQMDASDHPHVVATLQMQDILLEAMNQVDGQAEDIADNGPYMSVIHWNDAPTRTKEQVLQAFNLAIDIAKAREV